MNKFSGFLGNHFMVDLETLSVNSNAVICSVGIVEFTFNKPYPDCCKRMYYQTIDLQSCLDNGFEINAETLTWWLNQPDKTRLEINKKDSKHIKTVLEEISVFMFNNCSENKSFIWGNGSSFDLGILSNAYHKLKLPVPWKFWNERDVRTLVAFVPDIKKLIKNEGNFHLPLDDCLYQIKYCIEIFKILQNKS